MTEEEREEENEPRLILDEEEGYVCIDLDDDDYDDDIYVHEVGDFTVYEFDVTNKEDFKEKYLKILEKVMNEAKKKEGADSSETSSDDEE